MAANENGANRVRARSRTLELLCVLLQRGLGVEAQVCGISHGRLLCTTSHDTKRGKRSAAAARFGGDRSNPLFPAQESVK